MPFQQFTYPQVVGELGLGAADRILHGDVAPANLSDDLAKELKDAASFGSILGTEKARSEFGIAPVLWELRRRRPNQFGMFSGVELNADSSRGLNGVCDFVLTRPPQQHFLHAPLVAIMEAKNDNLRGGLGQCIAAMVAARLLNHVEGQVDGPVNGVVTTGTQWKFLLLSDNVITVDLDEYYISEAAKIMGILEYIIAS